MKKLVKENLNEQHYNINLEKEFSYYLNMSDIQEDPEYRKEFKRAIDEFGINSQNIGVITSYTSNVAWDHIKIELDKRQIEYYEFDLYDGESAILISMDDLNDEDEK